MCIVYFNISRHLRCYRLLWSCFLVVVAVQGIGISVTNPTSGIWDTSIAEVKKKHNYGRQNMKLAYKENLRSQQKNSSHTTFEITFPKSRVRIASQVHQLFVSFTSMSGFPYSWWGPDQFSACFSLLFPMKLFSLLCLNISTYDLCAVVLGIGNFIVVIFFLLGFVVLEFFYLLTWMLLHFGTYMSCCLSIFLGLLFRICFDVTSQTELIDVRPSVWPFKPSSRLFVSNTIQTPWETQCSCVRLLLILDNRLEKTRHGTVG